MALTAQEQTQLKALIAREGGIDAFREEVQALYVAEKHQAALAALASVVTLAISDWTALLSQVQAASGVTLYRAMEEIEAAVAARDAAKLGPLLVALAGAVRAHYRR